jgi:hypothetical protein
MEPDSRPQGKPLGFWLVLLGVIAALCVVALVVQHSLRQSGAQVQISQGGQVVATYPLDEDRTLEFTSESGGTNTVVIANGQAEVTQASCPDQVCVRHGPTTQTADPIVCLPNTLVVEVIGGEETQALDGVS